MKQKVENTIPVYDICSLHSDLHAHEDFIIERFSTYLLAHPNLHIAHRHSFYHIVLFTEGSGFHTIDFQQFPVSPNQIYFMVPGQVHSWAFEGAVDGFVINFSAKIFHNFLNNYNLLEQFQFFGGVAAHSVFTLPTETMQMVLPVFEHILKESETALPFGKEMICTQLLSLFILVSRVSTVGQESKTPLHHQLMLQHFYKLVEQYYKTKRLPKDYAALLYITANHLNALCQDLVGKSAGTVIRDRVILEAKRYLVNADISIAEIAYELDFSDNSYFTKFFKKYTQQTPEQFRKVSVGY